MEWEKYCSKPRFIKALQWFPGIKIRGVKEDFCGVGSVKTLYGLVYLKGGEFIICGEQNQLSVCKEYSFKEMYSKIEA